MGGTTNPAFRYCELFFVKDSVVVTKPYLRLRDATITWRTGEVYARLGDGNVWMWVRIGIPSRPRWPAVTAVDVQHIETRSFRRDELASGGPVRPGLIYLI